MVKDKKLKVLLLAAAVLVIAVIVAGNACGKKNDSKETTEEAISLIPADSTEKTTEKETEAAAETTTEVPPETETESTAEATPEATTEAAAETTTETTTEATTAATTEATTEATTAATTEAETVYRFRNKSLKNDHYEKHGIEMGFDSADAYEAAANAVVHNPDALHKTEAEDGDDVYYVEATNEFVVVSTDGYIRTYFLPSSGKRYYDRQ